MAIKRYTAESWDEALRNVKADLGDDAVILHSKTYKDGGFMGVGQRPVVEITATNDANLAKQQGNAAAAGEELDEATRLNYARLLEKAYAVASARSELDSDSSSPKPSPPAGAGQPKPDLFKNSSLTDQDKGYAAQIASLVHDISDLKALVATLSTDGAARSAISGLSPALEAVYEKLITNDVTDKMARDIVLTVARDLAGEQIDDQEQVLTKTVEVIAGLLPIAGPMQLAAKKTNTVALVGPTGVGKTTTLSKLAANLKIGQNSRVGFITIDTYRLGATEQLKSLANILDAPMRVVMNPNEIRTTIREMSSNLDAIFIDTAGRSQNDRMRLNELKTFLDAATPDETHLVISATTHPAHLASVLDHFGAVSVDKLILTKLDEAATFGPVLDVAIRAGKPLSYITVGQDIPDDIETASGQRLARLLLGLETLKN